MYASRRRPGLSRRIRATSRRYVHGCAPITANERARATASGAVGRRVPAKSGAQTPATSAGEPLDRDVGVVDATQDVSATHSEASDIRNPGARPIPLTVPPCWHAFRRATARTGSTDILG